MTDSSSRQTVENAQPDGITAIVEVPAKTDPPPHVIDIKIDPATVKKVTLKADDGSHCIVEAESTGQSAEPTAEPGDDGAMSSAPASGDLTSLGPMTLVDQNGYTLSATAEVGEVALSEDPTNSVPGQTMISFSTPTASLELTNTTRQRAVTMSDASYFPRLSVVWGYRAGSAACKAEGTDGFPLTVGEADGYCFIRAALLSTDAVGQQDLLSFGVGETKTITLDDFVFANGTDETYEVPEQGASALLATLRHPVYMSLMIDGWDGPGGYGRAGLGGWSSSGPNVIDLGDHGKAVAAPE